MLCIIFYSGERDKTENEFCISEVTLLVPRHQLSHFTQIMVEYKSHYSYSEH